MQYFDFLSCSRLMCFRVFVFVSWLAKASKTQRLKASNLQVASAGDAKRKQSARPSVRMSEGVLNLSKKTRGRVLSGVRVTRRGNRLRDFFFIIFFVPIFSCQNPSQGRSKEPPRDSKFTKNPTFCKKKSSPGPYFYRRFGRSIFSILFGSIFNAFFIKNR